MDWEREVREGDTEALEGDINKLEDQKEFKIGEGVRERKRERERERERKRG